MIVHYLDSQKEYKTLCNSKYQTTPSEEEKNVTCKKCKYILESKRLLSLKYKIEGEIIASDIRNHN